MTDVSKIKSIKVLESMKQDIDFFLKEPIIKELYYKKGEIGQEEFIDDCEDAIYLAEQIVLRLEDLKNPSKVKVSYPKKKREPKEVLSGEQPLSEHENCSGTILYTD